MNVIEKIDEYIKTLEEKETIDYDLMLSYFGSPLKLKNVKEFGNIDIDRLIKNVVLCYLYELGDEAFNKGATILKNKDFNNLYEAYKNFGFVDTARTIEPSFDKNGAFAEVNLAGRTAFELFGIEDMYDEEASDKERVRLIENQKNKLIEKYKKEVLGKDFLKDVFPLSYDKRNDLIDMVYNCLDDKFGLENLDEEVDLFAKKYPMFNTRKAFRTAIRNVFVSLSIREAINDANETLSIITARKNKDAKEKTTKIKKLGKIKSYLSETDFGLSSLDKIDFNLLFEIDKEIYLYVFDKIFVYQKHIYDNLKEENIALNKMNEASYLKNLFKKFKINYDELNSDVKLILNKVTNLNNLENNMGYLGINSNDDINVSVINFLINTSHKIVKEYEYYVKNKIVSKKLLLDNIDLFYNKDFKKNCIFMKDNNLSLENKIYDETILLKESTELSNSNKLLELYGKKHEENNFSYLFDPYNFDVLDILMENGININLLDGFSLSRKEVDNFLKRIMICDNLNIPIYANKLINTNFLLGNNFYIEEDCLDLYILKNNYEDENLELYIKNNIRNKINYNINEVEEFKSLEKFKSDDGKFYDINGIIISRLKVIRNLSLFYENNMITKETVLASIIYNSYLDDKCVEIIMKNIFAPVKIKKK